MNCKIFLVYYTLEHDAICCNVVKNSMVISLSRCGL